MSKSKYKDKQNAGQEYHEIHTFSIVGANFISGSLAKN
ncbi:hypothetical protein UF75_5491 [Desulfosporosinus sp. I2]|nr:hypothetical protein UF75_5491 [Desulfosporosinus sp. I2]